MEKFKAYRIIEENGKGRGRLVDMTLDELDPGEVVIRGAYSSVNYKDALSGDRRRQDRAPLSLRRRHRLQGTVVEPRATAASRPATR